MEIWGLVLLNLANTFLLEYEGTDCCTLFCFSLLSSEGVEGGGSRVAWIQTILTHLQYHTGPAITRKDDLKPRVML